MPQALCVSRSITSFVNINNLGSSPGVCKNTMDVCRWGNTLRVVAPIGVAVFFAVFIGVAVFFATTVFFAVFLAGVFSCQYPVPSA